MNEDAVKNLLQRFERAKAERSNFEKHWNDIAEVFSPAGAVFLEDNPQQGEKTNRFVFDSTGIHANELLSSGFFSLLTSPTSPWFLLTTTSPAANQEHEVKIWLNEVSKALAYEIQRPQTGFTTALHEYYLEYGAYGNAILFLTERRDHSSLLFQTLPLCECYCQENDEGFIDTLIRQYWRTAAQLAERFGVTNVSDSVQRSISANKVDDKFRVLHFILPNLYAQIGGIKNTDLPFLSVYIESESKHVLSVSGFDEQPFMAARFYKMPQETYGRGPGSSALSDVNMLQEMMKTILRAAQKIVDPPLMMPDQGFLTPPRMGPGNMNYYRSGSQDRIEPVQTGGRPDLGFDLISDTRTRIREMFFVDQLQLNSGPQMTATEVLQRTEEKLRLMGPVVGRASSELLSPMIVRAFSLLMRAGRLPDPPAALMEEGTTLKIVYTSPIVKAQEQVAANNLVRATQILLPFMSASPEAMDVFDTDRIAKGIGEIYNIDPTYYLEDESIQAKRQQRMQLQQQQQAAEQLKNTGIGINNLANAGQVLGETALPTGGL